MQNRSKYLAMFHKTAHEIRRERRDENVVVLMEAAENDPFLQVEKVRDWQYKVSRKGVVIQFWPGTNIALVPGQKYGIGMRAYEVLDALHSTPFFA